MRAAVIEQLFDEVERSSERKLITSALTIVEVANLATEKERRKLVPDFEERLDNLWQNRSLIEFVDFHEILAKQARTLMRLAIPLGYSLKPADAIQLASAAAINAPEFLTYDDLAKFSSLVRFKIVEPYVQQQSLGLSFDSSNPSEA